MTPKIIGVVFSIFVFSHALWAIDKKVVIVADAWCPYNCDETSREPGFMIDLAREILGDGGYTVTYVTEPWVTAISDVQSGLKDAIVGAGQSEAKDLVMAGEPLGENKTCFFTRSDDPFIYKSGDPLNQRRVGVTSGYLYGESIDKYIAQHRAEYGLVQIVTGDKPILQNLSKLRARRVDTIIENLAVMDFSVRKFLVDGVRLAGCEEPTPLYIAFSPKREDAGRLAELMNSGIRKLRKSGRMSIILARYGLKDWK